MNLFIDTNVLLNFFHLSGEDIEELKKLKVMLEHGKLTLWLPEQVCDEFERNRDAKIADATKATGTVKLGLNLPAHYRASDDYKALAKDLADLNKRYAKLASQVDQDVKARKLAADILVGELFLKAKLLPHDPKIYARAIDRMRHGNPPGKKSATIGDEINWEHLLAGVPSDEDIHIVSVDRDWASPLQQEEIHSFLAREWQLKKAGNAVLYTRIADFFEAHFPEIKLASDVAKNAAIERLVTSPNFQTTHSAVAALKKFMGTFTPADAVALIDALVDNSQVGWISDDIDIMDFFQTLTATTGGIPKGSLNVLESIYNNQPELEPDDDPITF